MKKIVVVLLFLCSYINCYADLTESQGEEVAAFASNMILESSKAPHIDSQGLPLIAYSQSKRTEGMTNQLSRFSKDDKGINSINANKWAFDCSSFASYVYYHTLGINAYYNDLVSPYTVKKFVEDANKQKHFYTVMSDINISNIDLNKLKKGDLIIIVGEHIMVYIGNGNIAHVSRSAINKGTNLGAEVTNLKSKYPGIKVNVIRIKNGLINENIKPNTIISWPDTQTSQDLGSPDSKPIININYDPKLSIEVNLNITIKDDKGLVGYYISKQETIPTNWLLINKQKIYNTYYNIKENGIYYVYTKDTKEQITVNKIEINNIDNTKPIIQKIEYQYQENNTFNILITATDNNKISYSLDGSIYKDEPRFSNLNKQNYTLYVKDLAGNIVTQSINLGKEYLPNLEIDYNTNYTSEVTLNIKASSINKLIGYQITKEFNEPNDYITINTNAIYKINENGFYYVWLKDENIAICQRLI